jgi:hypothetical protein
VRRRRSGGRPWLGGGPVALEEKGDGEGRLFFGGGGAQAALTVEGGWRWRLGKIPAKGMAPVVGGLDKWRWGTGEKATVCLGADERVWRRVAAYGVMAVVW